MNENIQSNYRLPNPAIMPAFILAAHNPPPATDATLLPATREDQYPIASQAGRRQPIKWIASVPFTVEVQMVEAALAACKPERIRRLQPQLLAAQIDLVLPDEDQVFSATPDRNQMSVNP